MSRPPTAVELDWDSAPLDFGQTYTYSGEAVNADGTATALHGSFHHRRPGTLSAARSNLDDGATVGVAAPIVLQFAGHVDEKARAAVEKALTVKSDQGDVGAWGWVPDNDQGSRVHYRTQEYWKAGSKVSVAANLYGVPLGANNDGKADLTLGFTIGPDPIVRANVNSHKMTVIREAPPSPPTRPAWAPARARTGSPGPAPTS